MNEQVETETMELLRKRYERDGYTFTLRPSSETLPQFMSGYQPDAIATKGNASIAVEVKSRRVSSSSSRLKDLATRFRDRPDWKLHVVYADEVEPEPVSTPDRGQVLARLNAIESMAANDNRDAALVLAWAALEAAARYVALEDGQALPKSPREALQLLEYMGRIDYQSAAAMRRTIELRNQVVHGDLTVAIPSDAISDLVVAVRSALAA